jgi:SAM-dependent methyltransferase
MNNAKHWNQIYTDRATNSLGWYKPHLETPLAWIDELGLDPQDPVIDVGAGASTLIDDLLARGHQSLTVLDLSSSAIQITRQRLGAASAAVTWLVGDVTELALPRRCYRLWHDRAVFHFLTRPQSQQKYRRAVLNSLEAGGYFIIGTFAPEAPAQCSGLPVQRYDTELLATTFGEPFELRQQKEEMHTTPGGVGQAYLYCLFQKAG